MDVNDVQFEAVVGDAVDAVVLGGQLCERCRTLLLKQLDAMDEGVEEQNQPMSQSDFCRSCRAAIVQRVMMELERRGQTS